MAPADEHMSGPQDVTECRRKAIEAEQEYRALFDHAGVSIGYYKPDGTIIWFNEIAAGYMGGQPVDFQGKSLLTLYPKREAQKYLLRIRHATQKLTPSSFLDQVTLPGGAVWLKSVYNCIRDEQDQILGVQIIAQDMTEQITAQHKLAESERKFRLMFDDAPMGYQSLDAGGNIITVNNAWIAMMGYTKEEVVGRWFGEFLAPDSVERFKNNLERFIRTGITSNELELLHKNGEHLIIRFSGRIARDANGQFIQTHCILNDITRERQFENDKRNMEARMREQDRLQSIGTLASGIAHEINNPINGIMNYSQLILDHLSDKGEVAAFAHEIIHESERISTIVRNLLQFSRQDKRSYSLARIDDIINQTLSLIKNIFRHDQIDLAVSVSEDLPLIKCRSQQIQQVLMNLLTNARDALNQKYSGYHEDKKLILSCCLETRQSEPWIKITVEDHGSGIPESIQDRIFDPFFTTKNRDSGTGLGLSICYGIVKEHHGTLTFETAAGIFTRFEVLLPIDNSWSRA
jgi:PAS domain S-box-containing protein